MKTWKVVDWADSLVDSLTWLSFSTSGLACPFLLDHFFMGYALRE
jgi:hypothetical protein